MSGAGDFWSPGRITSLWELMNKFDGRCLDDFALLMDMGKKWSMQGPTSQLFRPDSYELLLSRVKRFHDALQNAELTISAGLAKEFWDALLAAEVRDGDTRELRGQILSSAIGCLDALSSTFGREVDSRVLLIVRGSRAKLYQTDEPMFGSQFGDEVARKFKTRAKFEIGEASNCLATERHTACAFHLMRCTEVALDSVALCLQLPPAQNKHDKTWGAVLGRYVKELDGRENLGWPRQWTSLADQKLFKELYAALIAIKDAWRDPTMHLERTFTEREANHLFALTEGFLRKVASRLDEDGQPLA